MQILRKFIFGIFLLFHCQITNAQKYFIPDPFFRNYLISNYPSCMEGDSLITDSTTLSVITTVDANNLNIQDLSGIEYFTTLNELNCHSNKLPALPALPLSLKSLNCFTNQLTILPALPPKLEHLACGNNLLSKISSLPNTIKTIDCQYNFIDSLPPLPDSLISLLCGDNILFKLPALPQKLTYLNVYLNHISVFPALPDNLKTFKCGLNGIYALPQLPPALTELDCNFNYITSLTALPPTLQILYFASNKMSDMPILPPGLLSLDCSSNQMDFTDIVPVMTVPNFTYAPQDSIGSIKRDTIPSGNDFSIDVSEGYNPFNSYNWYKENQLISSDSRINASSDLFQISPALLSDSGTYYCSITNSKAPDLTLYVRPIYLSVTGNDVTGLMSLDASVISVYPNPSSDFIRIENTFTEKMKIQLINSQGLALFEDFIDFKSSKIFDISEFEKGFYLLTISNEKERINKKLILE